MESLNETTWDVVLAGTSFSLSLLALYVSSLRVTDIVD